VMTPNRGNPFISGFFSPVLCISCQQHYRLNVARVDGIDVCGYFL